MKLIGTLPITGSHLGVGDHIPFRFTAEEPNIIDCVVTGTKAGAVTVEVEIPDDSDMERRLRRSLPTWVGWEFTRG